MPSKDHDSLNAYSKTKRGRKLAEDLALSLLGGAITQGLLDPKGKSEEELKKDFYQLLIDFTNSPDREAAFIIDYRLGILQKARVYAKGKDYLLACTLYAIWVEHWLNSLIVTVGQKRGLDGEEINQLIRDSSFRSKLTWMFPLLGLKRLAIHHRNSLFRITDIRNGFVHYKWKGKDETSKAREQQELIDSLSNIEKTIKYLQQYENNYIFHRKKKVLKKIVKL
ncbi:MAG TPA: hypothetical protein VD835_10420 [Pyrinomonadaceae bacterium]|nr:hypothetical protein [Pyrinomonadaceae bacterium]